MKKRILIIGASGRIGHRIFQFFSKKNHTVFATHNSYKIIKKSRKLDYLDRNSIKNAIKVSKPDYIFHLAAFTNPEKNKKNKNKSNENLEGTKNIVNEIKKNKNIKLIFFSTDKVYENNPKMNIEKFNVKPSSNYAVIKLKCEKMITKYLKNYIILRVPIINEEKLNYKIHKNWSPNLTEDFMLKIKKNQKLKVFKNIYRSFVYISDLNNLLEKIILSKIFHTGIYNIGSKKYSYFYRLLEIMKKNQILRKKNLVKGINGKAIPKTQSMNTNKIKKVYQFKFS
tara:strand:- start:338 stop:1186 length:849 start_codon:yes stop_codon:yes gene_type:complete